MITITVNAKELKNAVQLCSKVAPKKSTLPVLQNALISVVMENGVQLLRLFATNLETGVIVKVPCTVASDYSCFVGDLTTVNVISFAQAIKPAKSTVDLVLDPKKGFGYFTANSYKLTTIDIAEFPPVPVASPEAIVLPLSTGFAKAVNMVAFAAGTDDARPVLTGIHIYTIKDSMILEAANGFILSRRVLPRPESPAVIDINIPAKALSLFAKVADTPDNAPTLTTDKTFGRAMLTLDNVTVVAGFIDGTYPDIDQIIPRSNQTTTIFNTKELLAACEQAMTLAKFDPDNEGASKAGMYPAAIVMELGKDQVQTGWRLVKESWHDNTTPLLTWLNALSTGNTMTIGFNAEWLHQALQSFDNDTCTLSTSLDTAPGAFSFDDHGLYLQMPIYLTDIDKVITLERSTIVPADKVQEIIDNAF